MRHIVVATDQNFVVPTATTLRSISLQDTDPMTIWILATQVNDASRSSVAASLVGTHVRLEWIEMEGINLGDTTRSLLGPASFSRLAIGDLLPHSVDRVLYMDVDMLVTDSLAPLWDITDADMAAWAVRSVHFPSICTYGAMDHWPELQLDPRAPYFNSGLLMINMAEWRALDVGRKALSHLASPLANGALADQEALNVILAGRWGELDPRWNQQTPLLQHNRGAESLYEDGVLRRAREDPAVIHYLDRPKPWHRDCTHPFREAWRRMADETAFAPISLESTPLASQLKWRVRRAASALIKGR